MNINNFIKYIRFEKRFSENTINSYETDLVQFRNFILLKSNDETLIPEYKKIRAWIASLSEKGLSSTSINRKVSSLKSYVKYLMKLGYITKNPMLKIVLPKRAKRLPEFVQENQMNDLDNNSFFTDDFFGLRDRFMIELFYNTGMRLSELINLKHKDIDVFRANVKILGKGNKERIVPFNTYINNMFNNYVSKKSDFGFSCEANDFLLVTDKGNKMYPNFVYRKIQYYLGLVSRLDKRSPHVLRHSFATHMLNNGADLNSIKELLGHTSLVATQVYTHNTFSKIKTIYKQAHPRAQ
ncbi:MAG: tyrosine-type recombinase/integrase [Bacteroidales bacterium]|nr:tyrosine-type recombinase/integrase [Bacteroidales bacterium]MCK9498241.1 tyrosine-type recombinase/integrase [Bacteroidales bacterium]MDY0315248.1 tyrosine-type recombinase/integrase [Bacteroidales bacterium]NLB85541.1 tyrosine-type recombinase/integrase [Bacteroidales bacterium]